MHVIEFYYVLGVALGIHEQINLLFLGNVSSC